jgi:hypothetical protein
MNRAKACMRIKRRGIELAGPGPAARITANQESH